MPLNDALACLGKSRVVKRVLSTSFDGISDSYIFKIRAELVNGWLLDYWEHKIPNLRRYSFHVFYNRQMIVRWDNTPHYPKLKGFPNHKHECKAVVSSEEMTIEMVLEQLDKMAEEKTRNKKSY